MASRLRDDMNDTAFAAWFGSARATGLEDGRLSVCVPNEFTRAWIEGHFSDLVERAAGDVAVRFEVTDASGPSTAPPAAAALAPPTPRPTRASRQRSAPEAALERRSGPDAGGGRFLPKYTFDSFVIGASNRFSHAAALAVGEAPGQAYNPLLIYGGTGLGKTHLLQAIGQYVTQHMPQLTARYLTCESFTNEFIDALRDKRIESFKGRYRSQYDLLLMDDIQFLAGKERSQEEFFHTFNSLHESGKQLVLSCDRPVREIPDLTDRLRSRFEWGLITDVQAPDLETRIAILKRRVAADRVRVDDAVLAAIARRVTANIRELEGALTRVLAFASLTGRPVTPDLVRETLHDLEGSDRPVTVQAIQEVVAASFGVGVGDLCSQRRTQDVVHPRQIAMYLARELTDSSLPRIGGAFGGRDHTTVLYAVNKITQRIREDRLEYNLVHELITRVKRRGG